MIWLAWITFAVTLILAVLRLPSVLRGGNRLMLSLYCLLAAAVLLSIPAPYEAIDAVLGGVNLTNLILRFLLFGICLLLAVRIARAFGAGGAERLLLGPWGLGALAAICAGTVLAFLLMGKEPSAAGMGQSADDPWFGLYSALGRLYPTITGLVLLPTLFRSVRTQPLIVLRIAAGLLAAAYVLLASTTSFAIMPPTLGWLMAAMNYGTILLLLSGLATIWVAGRVARRGAEA